MDESSEKEVSEDTENVHSDESNKIFRPKKALMLLAIIVGSVLIFGSVGAYGFKQYACSMDAKRHAVSTTKWLAESSDDEELKKLAAEDGYTEEIYQTFYDGCQEYPIIYRLIYEFDSKLNT